MADPVVDPTLPALDGAAAGRLARVAADAIDIFKSPPNTVSP
jgi:hypothetical protein